MLPAVRGDAWPGRRKPYTQAGVRRLACVRCGDQAETQWQICSDGNTFRPLCLACDVALNRLVLDWMGHPRADELAATYEAEMVGA